MKTSWDIAVLREHIDDSLGRNHELRGVIDAIGRYEWIFLYHFSTARDAMKGIINDKEPHGIKNMEFLFGLHEQQAEFYQAKLISEAHILGCIHSVRAIFDVFSHLVNGLVLNNSLKTIECDIKKIEKQLTNSKLKTELSKLLKSHWFQYIDAFINTAKHRGLVQHTFQVSFVGATSGIKLVSFKYKGETFPSYSADELLQGVLEVKNRVVDCGQLLNNQVISDEI